MRLRWRLGAAIGACVLTVLGLLALDVHIALQPQPLARRLQAALDRVLLTPYSLSSVEASVRRGVRLEQLIVADRSGRPALRVERIETGLDWRRLALAPIRITGPELWVRRGTHSAWNLLELLDPALLRSGAESGTRLPRLEIEIVGATLHLEDPPGYPPGTRLRLAGIDARVRTDPDEGVVAQLRLPPPVHARWKSLELVLRLPPESGLSPMVLGVHANKVEVDPGLRRLLPTRFRTLYDRLQPHGVGDLALEVTLPPDGGRPQLDGSVLVHAGGMRLFAFPYPVEDVTGRIEIRTRRIALRGLEGRRGAARYRGEGEITLNPPGIDDTIDVRVQVEQLPLDDALEAALPTEVRAIYRRFSPRGSVGGRVRVFGTIKPPGIEDEIHWRIEARARGLEAAFDAFPVPVRDLRGTLWIEDETLHFERLHGRCRGGTIEASGRLDEQRLEIALRGTDIGIDPALGRELDAEQAAIARRLEPDGRIDLQLAVRGRTDPATGAMPVRYEARLTPQPGLRLRPADFPYPLVVEGGTVRIEPSGARIEAVRCRGAGEDNPLRLVATGFVPASPSVPRPLSLRIEAHDLPIDERLQACAQTLREREGEDEDEDARAKPHPVPAILEATGLSAGRVRRLSLQIETPRGTAQATEESEPAVRVTGALQLEGGRALPPAFPYPVDDWSAELLFSPSSADVIRFRARLGPARLEAAGRIALAPGISSNLRARLQGLPIDARLREALGGSAQAVLEALGARGSLAVQALLHGRVGGTGRERLTPEAEIVWTGGSLHAEAFPYPVTAVAATLHYTGARLEIDAFEGRLGPGTISAGGWIRTEPSPPSEDPPPRLQLRLAAHKVAIDDTLRAALPAPVRDALETLGAAGRFALRTHLALLPDPVGEGMLVWNAELHPELERLEVGLTLEQIDAVARLHGRVPIGALEHPQIRIDGGLEVRRLRYRDQSLDEAHARLRLDSRLFELREIRGSLLGGLLRGELYVFLEPPALFGMRLDLAGARVERWVGGPTDKQGRALRGLARGRLRLYGRRADPQRGQPAMLQGEAKVQIRPARLWKVPVVSGPLYFDRAQVVLRFDEDERIHIDYAELSSEAITFTGRGWLEGGRARVRLVHELGRPVIDRVPVIGWLWRLVKGSLVAIEISGPLDDARVIAIPLPAVVDPFRDLFGK